MKQKLKNNICFCLDSSGSMSHLRESVIAVFNQQIAHLIERSKETEQETRVSVFTFDDNVKNACWDTDVLRTPSIEEFYKIGGMTAMIDATRQAITDLKKIPEMYHDPANLIIVISDGNNNLSNHLASTLKREMAALPDHWTVAFLGPNQEAINQAKMFGFEAGNCQIWDTSKAGLLEAGQVIKKVTDNFMAGRATGVRSTKNLFTVSTTALTKSVVTANLDPLDPKDYTILQVRKPAVIREFVESWKLPYYIGCAYFELSKPEKISPKKLICLKEKKTGKVYSGAAARQILGLPDYEVKVNTAQHPDYTILVQSSSVNRNLMPGTELLVMK